MSTTNILDLNNRIDELEKNSGGGGSADSAKRSDIATEFNTTTAYTAGCYVYHEGKLYQFNADHAAGAWDPTDVVEANVTDQVVSNKAAIDNMTASDVAYDNTDSGLTATDVQGAIDEVAEKIGNMRMTKLWENPNPSSDFYAGYITGLLMSGYEFFVVTTPDGTCLFPSTQRGILCLNGSSAGVKYFFRRTFTPDVSNNKITVSDCVGTKLTDGSETNFNQSIIPLTIYGIKLT